MHRLKIIANESLISFAVVALAGIMLGFSTNTAYASSTVSGVGTTNLTVTWDTPEDVVWQMRNDVGTSDTSGATPYTITVSNWNAYWSGSDIKLWLGEDSGGFCPNGGNPDSWTAAGCVPAGSTYGYTVQDGVWVDLTPEEETPPDTGGTTDGRTPISVYDALYWFLMAQLAGFVLGLTFSMFFHWPKFGK